MNPSALLRPCSPACCTGTLCSPAAVQKPLVLPSLGHRQFKTRSSCFCRSTCCAPCRRALPSPPLLSRSCHTGLLTAPPRQAPSCLRAFAQAVLTEHLSSDVSSASSHPPPSVRWRTPTALCLPCFVKEFEVTACSAPACVHGEGRAGSCSASPSQHPDPWLDTQPRGVPLSPLPLHRCRQRAQRGG